MATVSNTRPPPPGEVSSAPEGEAAVAQDVPWETEPPAPAALPAPPTEPVVAKSSGAPARVDFKALSSMPVATRPPVAEPALPGQEDGTSVVVDPALLTLQPGATPLPGTSTPPPGMPLPVLLLVDQARDAPSEEQQELARRINRWLEQMAREGGSRHVADWFHHLIESGRLEDLVDEAGHDCHDTAVKGLLAMGFPYALEVRPEDLERVMPPPASAGPNVREWGLKGSAAAVLVGGISLELIVDTLGSRPMTGLLTTEVGLALLALVAGLVSQPRTALRNMGLAVLLVVSALSVCVGILGGSAGLVAGLAGLVATLLLALHRS